jgi:hypothetical protein
MGRILYKFSLCSINVPSRTILKWSASSADASTFCSSSLQLYALLFRAIPISLHAHKKWPNLSVVTLTDLQYTSKVQFTHKALIKPVYTYVVCSLNSSGSWQRNKYQFFFNLVYWQCKCIFGAAIKNVWLIYAWFLSFVLGICNV